MQVIRNGGTLYSVPALTAKALRLAGTGLSSNLIARELSLTLPQLKLIKKYPNIKMNWEYWVIDPMFLTKYKFGTARESLRVAIKEGRLIDANGSLISQGKTTKFLYVMDDCGNFYLGKLGQVDHHSSFLAGMPVASAGWISIENGKITTISRASGHYRPPESAVNNALQELKNEGVQVEKIKVIKEY